VVPRGAKDQRSVDWSWAAPSAGGWPSEGLSRRLDVWREGPRPGGALRWCLSVFGDGPVLGDREVVGLGARRRCRRLFCRGRRQLPDLLAVVPEVHDQVVAVGPPAAETVELRMEVGSTPLDHDQPGLFEFPTPVPDRAVGHAELFGDLGLKTPAVLALVRGARRQQCPQC